MSDTSRMRDLAEQAKSLPESADAVDMQWRVFLFALIFLVQAAVEVAIQLSKINDRLERMRK